MNIREELQKIYKDLFDVVIREENENLSFKMLGIDSLQVVELFVSIEENMGCDIYDSDSDLMEVRTFNDMVEVINSCQK